MLRVLDGCVLGLAMRLGMFLLVEDDPLWLDVAPSALLAGEVVQGWELWRRGWSPYTAHACQCPPLLVLLGGIVRSRWRAALLACAGDLATATLLGRYTRLAWQSYWLNPATAAACALGSVQPWANAAALAATASSPATAGILLAATAYVDAAGLSMAAALFAAGPSRRFALGFAATSAALVVSSRFVVGDFLHVYLEPDLEPSLGVGWYTLMVVFDRFYSYFRVAFAWHAYIYALPLGWRLAETPDLAGHAALAVTHVFKANPTFSDAAFDAALAAAHFGRYHHVRAAKAAILAAALAALLPVATRPVARRLWLGTGTGNANHLYFQTAVFSAAFSYLACVGLQAAVSKRRLRRRKVD